MNDEFQGGGAPTSSFGGTGRAPGETPGHRTVGRAVGEEFERAPFPETGRVGA